MSKLQVLKQLKNGNEDIIAIFLPTEGKVGLSEFANALGVSQDMLQDLIVEKDIKVHKLSKYPNRLVSKWVVDVEDFWRKT